MKKKLTLPMCSCKNCGHKWVARIVDPARCPGCGVAKWDKKRKNKEAK